MNEDTIDVVLKYLNKDPDSVKMYDYWTDELPISQIPNRNETISIKGDDGSIRGYIEYVEKVYEAGKLIRVILTLEWVEVE